MQKPIKIFWKLDRLNHACYICLRQERSEDLSVGENFCSPTSPHRYLLSITVSDSEHFAFTFRERVFVRPGWVLHENSSSSHPSVLEWAKKSNKIWILYKMAHFSILCYCHTSCMILTCPELDWKVILNSLLDVSYTSLCWLQNKFIVRSTCAHLIEFGCSVIKDLDLIR